jgi:hypothetical protein
VFVLTLDDGLRLYGHCHRRRVEEDATDAGVDDDDEGVDDGGGNHASGDVAVYETLCILSRHAFNATFAELLEYCVVRWRIDRGALFPLLSTAARSYAHRAANTGVNATPTTLSSSTSRLVMRAGDLWPLRIRDSDGGDDDDDDDDDSDDDGGVAAGLASPTKTTTTSTSTSTAHKKNKALKVKAAPDAVLRWPSHAAAAHQCSTLPLAAALSTDSIICTYLAGVYSIICTYLAGVENAKESVVKRILRALKMQKRVCEM